MVLFAALNIENWNETLDCGINRFVATKKIQIRLTLKF